MELEVFWKLIDSARKSSGGDGDELCSLLQSKLIKRDPKDIVAFKHHLDTLMARAYTWDLWAAAYVINGGCSDDGFEYFRAWLISRGSDTFEKALANPDSLTSVRGLEPDECELESLLYVAAEAYEEAAESELPDSKVKRPAKPAGKRWSEEGDDLAKRVPKLWKKFSEG